MRGPGSARSSSSNRATRIAIHAMVAVGGVAALSWEVLWQHHASLAIGVSARGTAITLAATMAGITVGSLIGGRWLIDRMPHPIRLYGVLEAVIGQLYLVVTIAWLVGVHVSQLMAKKANSNEEEN